MAVPSYEELLLRIDHKLGDRSDGDTMLPRVMVGRAAVSCHGTTPHVKIKMLD